MMSCDVFKAWNELGKATIKAVLSGDTVVLMGTAVNGPPPELTLTLASLQAPKLARNPEQSNEVS